MTQPVRVLVVHTDTADLAVVASVAAAHAFELCVVGPTPDLPAIACREQPDAVVLELGSRAPEAFAVLVALRADARTAGIPVIAIVGSHDPEVRRRAFAAGADDVFDKPIQRQALAHRLHSFARLRRAWVAAWAELQP